VVGTNLFNRPTGDFIVSYHPEHEGLFLATGGSGHGFKFFTPSLDTNIMVHGNKVDPAGGCHHPIFMGDIFIGTKGFLCDGAQ